MSASAQTTGGPIVSARRADPTPPAARDLLDLLLIARDRDGSDPERFEPERFLGENGCPRYAFLPFGGGRRICVGGGLAMLEATLVLAGISQSHRLELTADAMPRGRAEVTYRPRGPVPMRCTPRPGAPPPGRDPADGRPSGRPLP